MAVQLELPSDVATHLIRHETKPLLRFITCGSVDDGKSTLIGRLLFDTRVLLDDQLLALEAESRRFGTRDGDIDLALLVDGLAAEREQGITIDVAYRFFTTERRKFIVADCPGHEQYTRNMATGASTAELAIVLVDARKGLLAQTRRHSYIVSLLGIRHVVLAVNKMDLVSDGEAVFEAICESYGELAQQFGIAHLTCIPISALRGDNVIHRSDGMDWYDGPALLEHLETVDVEVAPEHAGMSLPVQWVCRPDQNFRGFAGTVGSGVLTPGMEVVVLPSGRRSRVQRVLVAERDVPVAAAGQAVTITLADEVDASRGDLIAGVEGAPEVADQFSVHLLWLGEQPLLPGRGYVLRTGSRSLNAQVTEIKHRVDVNSQQLLAARHLELNEVGQCKLHLDQPIPFRPYAENRGLGAFILIDRQSNETVAAGTLDFALRRAANIHWHASEVDKRARSRASGHPPRCIWLTGLSGSGKSSIASLAEQRLHAAGCRTYTLDGDNLRHGLNKDLGFTDEDRVENIRRAAEVARLMVDAGLVVLVSFISPFREERRMARSLFEPEEFLEVFVDVPLAVAEQRDVKGLYAKARAGELPNFTGIDSAYEVPEDPDLRLDTATLSVEEAVDRLVARVI